MATLKDGAIEIALNDGYMFTNVSNDDFIIRTTTSNQSIHIGTTSNASSALQITQTNVALASNLYVANALAVGTSNIFSRINVAGGINMVGGDLYKNNILYLTDSNSMVSLFRVGAPIKQTFRPASVQSNFAVTVNGDFSANVRDTDVYVNGAKLAYLNPASNDYTIAETRNGLNTTFTVSVSYPIKANDIVDVTIWPSLSNFFSQNMLVLSNNVFPILLGASNFNSNVLRITNNIGVGTTVAPSEALDINIGNAKVASNIYALNRIAIAHSNPQVTLDANTSTDAIALPRGTTAQRPGAPVQGYMRYNTTTNTFEGYGPGNSWGSLGGVRDTNQDTYITPELVAGSNDDILRFFNSNIESMRINALGNVGISNNNPTERLDVANGNARFSSNVYVLQRLAIAGSNPTEAVDIMAGNLKTASNIYAMQCIAIAASNPTESLDVRTGNAKMASNVYVLNRLSVAGSNPTESIDVSQGNLKVSSNVYVIQRLSIASSNPTEALDITAGNLKTASNIYALQRIAVAGSNPTEALDILQGNAKVASNLYVINRISTGASNPSEALDITQGNIKGASNIYALVRMAVGASNPTESLDVRQGNLKVSSNVYAMQNMGVGTSNPTVALEVVGNAKFNSNLEVVGNLTIQGTTTTVNSTTVNIADNIIRLNNGAAYLTSLQAGVEVNRGGACNNYFFVFDEPTQYFRVGLQGSLQTVATRDDNPTTNTIAIYDAANKKYTGCNVLAFNNNMLDVATTIQVTPAANSNALQGFLTGIAAEQNVNIVLGQSNTASNSTLIRYNHQGINNAANTAQFGLTGFSHITCQGNGMVGINNAAPSNRLDVAGNLRLRHTQALHMSLHDASGTATNSLFMDFNNANSTARGIIGLDGAGFRNISAGALTMATWTNHDMLFITNQNERMRITNTGLVGIGMTPLYALDVRGAANSIMTRFSDGTTELTMNPGRRFTSNVDGWITLDPNGGATSGLALWDNMAVAGGVAIGTDSTFGQATVPSGNLVTSGNIGVGTTNPQSRLDVAGGVRVSHNQNLQLTIRDTSGTATNALFMDFNNANTTARGIIGLDGTGFINTSAGALTMSTWTNHNLIFGTNQVERMRMTSNGNLGIGTNNPQYRLHVSGAAYFPDGIVTPGIAAQWALSGGGSVTWSANKLLWSQRVVAIPVERSEFGSIGYIDITCPTSGTITVFTSADTVSTVTCDAGGIPMTDWFGLFYEVTPGQANASDPTRFRLVHHNNTTWRPTTNWLLIAATNWDTQNLKWIPGNAYIASGSTFTTTGSGGGGGVGWYASGANIVSMSNVGVGIVPVTRFHVGGAATTLDNSTGGDHRVIIAKQNATSVASIIFAQGGNTVTSGMTEIGLTGDNSLAFKVNATAGTYVTRMLMTASNIGINNISPQELLHVSGKMFSDTQYLSTSNDSTTVPSYSFREDSNTGMYHASNQIIGFTTAGVDRMRVGSAGVGINTILAPACTLDVNGNMCVKSTTIPEVRLINSNNNQQCTIACATSAAQFSTSALANDLIIRSDNATSRVHIQASNQSAGITVNSNNFVGVNVTNPTYRLHVNGDIFATADILAFSDSNLKTDLMPISNALTKVTSLRGYTYRRLDHSSNAPRQAGLLAQEVQQVLPEVVHTDPASSNLSIAYGNLAALFVEAFKDMQKEITHLKQQLEQYQNNK